MSSVDFLADRADLADLGASADAHAVAGVLSAAAAPPWPHELRGYETARRAFVAAGTAAGTTPIRHTYGRPVRRLIGVKLAAVAGALTVTGVAVAAEANVLPSPIQRAAHQMLGGVGVPDPDPVSRGGQAMASSTGSESGAPGSSSLHRDTSGVPSSDPASGGHSSSGLLPTTPVGTADPSADPSQTVTSSASAEALNLCRAYVAHKGNGDGSGDSNGNGGLSAHDKSRLAALAGGADQIDDYCARLLAGASGGGTATSQPSDGSTAPDASPDPGHDHKPDPTGGTTGPNAKPGTSAPADPPSGAGTHSHAPSSSRSTRGTRS